MRNIFKTILIVVLVLPFLACLLSLMPMLEFMFASVVLLAIGWVFFLVRVVPQLTVDWGMLLTGVMCLWLVGVGMHGLGRWAYHESKELVFQPWRLRWSIAIVSVTILAFVAGIAMVGVAHQTAWLFSSPEPITDTGFPVSSIESQTHLRQIVIASHSFHEKKDVFPTTVFDDVGNPLHGWQTQLLPYLDYQRVYKSIDLTKSWRHDCNTKPFQKTLPEYVAGSISKERKDSEGRALSHYASNVHLIGGRASWKITDIRDGASTTLMFGEAFGNFKPWGHPANWRDPMLGINKTLDGFGHRDRPGANFAVADASVRYISKNVSPEVLKALSTPDGGEAVDDTDW